MNQRDTYQRISSTPSGILIFRLSHSNNYGTENLPITSPSIRYRFLVSCESFDRKRY